MSAWAPSGEMKEERKVELQGWNTMEMRTDSTKSSRKGVRIEKREWPLSVINNIVCGVSLIRVGMQWGFLHLGLSQEADLLSSRCAVEASYDIAAGGEISGSPIIGMWMKFEVV